MEVCRSALWGPALALSCALGTTAACSSATEEAPAPTPVENDAAAPVPTIVMPTGDPSSWAIDAAGPFNVGHRVIETKYVPPSSPSSSAAAAAERTIPIDVWYPTLDAGGDHPVYKVIFKDDDVYEGAKVAPPIDGKGYPVHVYSHGSFGFGGTASNMARWFASHGWVYAAPNHVGNMLGDDSFAKRPFSIYWLRSNDVSATLDTLDRIAPADPLGALAGKLRTKRVLLSGHSFGAFTVWASAGVTFDVASIKAKCDKGDFAAPCTPDEIAVFGKSLADPRFVAFVPMAGGMTDWVTDYDAPAKPVLMMSGSQDVSGQPIFDRTKTLDLTWLDFRDGCHELFALGGCRAFDEKLGWKLTGAWALAWGRRFVMGDATERVTKLVTNEAPLDPTITFKHNGTLHPPSGEP